MFSSDVQTSTQYVGMQATPVQGMEYSTSHPPNYQQPSYPATSETSFQESSANLVPQPETNIEDISNNVRRPHPTDAQENPSKRSKSSTPMYNIPTHSRYEPLANLQESSTSTSSHQKVPPITVIGMNYPLLLQDIAKVVHNNYSTKSRFNEIQILFTDIDDHRNFRKFCESNNIQFYTFQDPSKKAFQVMFKDIPISLSELEIFNELIRLEYPVLQVRRLYDKLRHPLQTCAIDLTDSHQARTILKLDRLFHSIIKVQPKSNRFTPVQCKNCQRFGHSQANCKLKPRCVKCSQPHHYSVCPKPQSTPPTCVNCGQTHSANYIELN